MKKLIAIAAAALLLGGTVSAQETTSMQASSSASTKATAGAITVEGQLSLWGPTNVIAPLIRGRYFLTDDLAVRLQLGFFTNNNTTNFAEQNNGEGGQGSRERTNSMFDIRLGIEKHLGSHEKFSPYLAAEFMFGSGSATETWTNSDNGNDYEVGESNKISGGWNGGGTTYNPGTTIGLNLIIGADYYVFDQLYVGAEFGYGFTSNNRPDVVTERTSGNTTVTTVNLGGSSSALGMYNMNGGLRIGLRF